MQRGYQNSEGKWVSSPYFKERDYEVVLELMVQLGKFIGRSG